MNQDEVDKLTQNLQDVQLNREAGDRTDDDWPDAMEEVDGGDKENDSKSNGPTVDYNVDQIIRYENWSRLSQMSNVQHSSEFLCGGLRWRLMLFPRGLARRPGSMACFVEALDLTKCPGGQQHVECKLSLINHVNETQNTNNKFVQVLHLQCTDQGFDNVIPLANLRQPGWVVDDAITFRVSMELPNPNLKFGGRKVWNSRKETGYVGLVNQGATCYMSSLLQSMFHIPQLRRAVFQMPIVDGQQKMRSIPWQLQRLFYELQASPNSPQTRGLTRSFGWTDQDAFRQHDIQEFARVLQDKLEEKMKGSPADGTMKNLFVGTSQTYVECVNVEYVSKREEHFYDLSMNVKGCPTLYKSFENYIEVEELKGSNQYRAEKFGLQDARKGTRFIKFPPVLQIQLKRFEYDPYQDQMVKINDRLEFPTELDLTNFLADVPESDRSKAPVYHLLSVLVHVGGIHGGHYYAFVRPSAKAGGQWFKFDDEIVTKVEEKEAVQDNYGGAHVGQYGHAVQKLNSAYMLTYVRADDVAEIMRPLTEEEVPPAVVEGVKEEDRLRVEEAAAKRRASMMTTVEVLLERDLVAGPPNVPELGAGSVAVARVAPRRFQIEKFKTLDDLREVIEREVGIPKHRQAFFRMVRRENRCIRPNQAVQLEDYTKRYFGPIDSVVQAETQLPATSPVWSAYSAVVNSPDYFYLHELPEDQSTGDVYATQVLPNLVKGGSKALVSFKFFDVRTQRLEFLASRIIDRSLSVEQLFPLLRELSQGRVGADTPLRFFEENRAPSSLPEYALTDTMTGKGVISGDIFCFCENLNEATLHEIHDGWQAEQQRVIDEARAARKAAKEAEAAKEAAAKEATALGKTDEKKEEKTPAPKETAKDKEEIIVPVKPLFHQTPDSLLRALAFVVRVKMEKRESDPVFHFFIDLYSNRSPDEAIVALAEYLGEPVTHARLFSMNMQRQYLLDRYLTHSDTAGTLAEHIQHHKMFVFEVLDHSVDLLKTHIQANVNYCDDKLNLTVVRPMCPRDGDLNAVWAVVKEMLEKDGVAVPEGPVRALDVESNCVVRVLPLDTPGAQVWDWAQGFSNPRKNIRMEVIPVEERDVAAEQLAWCHSAAPGAGGSVVTFGVPFAIRFRDGETVADLRLRLAARLGENPEAVKRSWKLCSVSGYRYEALPEDAVLSEVRLTPMMSAAGMRYARDPASQSTLPALGIQRPDNRLRQRYAAQDQGIRINESAE